MFSSSLRRFPFLPAVLLAAAPVLAQGTTGVIRGRVTDSAGAGLPAVVVIIRSAAQPTGNSHVVTDREGRYRSGPLPVAADYTLKVDRPGYAAVQVGPIGLDPGRVVVQDITLRTEAESTETVEVEARGSTVDTESTKTSTAFDAEFLSALPIIGHDYQDILVLAPGVTDTDGDGNPNVHGARDTGLQYRLDGGNITDPMTGSFGQNLNMDMIEEIEIITAGASAEYGRADGGFTNIVTRSGGNDFEGKFSLYWQGRFLNGDGANNNDVNTFHNTFPDYQDLRPTLTIGGAIARDRLWYFGTVELLQTERPVSEVGTNLLVTSRGHYGFAKLTWQPGLKDKLSFQVTSAPQTFEGLGLSTGVSPDSDYRLSNGGVTPQIKWTSAISPQLLLETTLTSFNRGTQIEPVSKYFEPAHLVFEEVEGTTQVMYPCKIYNCNPQRGERSLYQFEVFTGRTYGAYFLEQDGHAEGNGLRTDLSFTIENAGGQHAIKAGFEAQDETYRDSPLKNPVLYDATKRYVPRAGTAPPPAEAADYVEGSQTLLVFEPQTTPMRADGFTAGLYVLDAWKPRPNLTVNAGVRLDRENVDSWGYTPFDPRAERNSAMVLWKKVCSAADSLDRASQDYGLVETQNCYQFNDRGSRYNGLPPNFGPRLPLDHSAWPVTDPAVRALDLDGDGDIEPTGQEGDAFLAGFTKIDAREPGNFSIQNTNLSPRLSVSWDPGAAGRNKLFGTWGRYYDRLFLGTVALEMGSKQRTYGFVPNFWTNVIAPGVLSRAASNDSITQTARGLKTPRTDELTLGFERELAPEWSGGLTYVLRKGRDLLQDTDLNHITCPQFETLGVNPYAVCGGDGGLVLDRFGDVGGTIASSPTEVMVGGEGAGFNAASGGQRLVRNGAPDLYAMSPTVNQVLRIENANSYEYEALEAKIVRRLHRNWQMQVSYTWSEAFGQAESFKSSLGDDPQTKDDEEGYLSYDQRHIFKAQVVTRLPHEISLGSIVQWASGTPYSLTASVGEFDSLGNIMVRTFYPTGQRNDTRNEGIWRVDGRVEKSFVMGSAQASAYLSVRNMLNDDSLVVRGQSPYGYITAAREFGRTFELGAAIQF